MKILALDAGKKDTGWAVWDHGNITYGLKHYNKLKSYGDVYYKYMWDIRDLIRVNNIQYIAIEQPTARGRAVVIQYGMFAIPQLLASLYNKAYLNYWPSEIQAFTRRLTKDMTPTDIQRHIKVKDSKLPSCTLFAYLFPGVEIEHNIADAVALLVFAAHEQGIDILQEMKGEYNV